MINFERHLTSFVKILLLLCITTAAAETTEEWFHFMTVNPNDGQTSWCFTCPAWYEGFFGEADGTGDFVNDTVRHTGMIKIRLESSRNGHTVSQTYALKDEYKGWSFYKLIMNLYNTAFTNSPESSQSFGSTFDDCPLMNSDGPLYINFVQAYDSNRWFGFRLTNAHGSYSGMGADYRLLQGVAANELDRQGQAIIKDFSAAGLRSMTSATSKKRADVSGHNQFDKGQGSDRGDLTSATAYLYKIYILPSESPKMCLTEDRAREIAREEQTGSQAHSVDPDAWEKRTKEIAAEEYAKLQASIPLSTSPFWTCSEENLNKINCYFDMHVQRSVYGVDANEMLGCVWKSKPWVLVLFIC